MLEKIVDVLRDVRTTAIHLVTLAEEMPVAETLETHAELVGPLAMSVGSVIVNRVHHRRFSPAALTALREAAKRAGADERALLRAVCERAAEESGWSDINAAYLARLRAAIRDVPIVELPFLFVEEFDRGEVDRLSRELEAASPERGVVSALRP